MIGSNIKRLRTERGMTQKALADKLFVSAQAVSRWENNEVEPSLTTITEMAKIFGVSTDEILGVAPQPKKEQPEENSSEKSSTDENRASHSHESSKSADDKNQKEENFQTPPTVLTLCTKCNSPIYFTEDIFRLEDKSVICKKCYKEKLEREKKAEEAKYRAAVEAGKKRRIISFVISSILLSLGFLGGIYGIIGSIGLSCLISCIILKNNFIPDMCAVIFSFSFVKWPGIIFSFGIDGCLFFIGIKILFFILGILISIVFAILLITIGSIVAIFVYPYAIHKNFTDPAYTKDLFEI